MRRRKPGASAPRKSPHDTPLELTLYLKHRRGPRRRPGSKADLAELTPRVSYESLAAERRKLLSSPIAAIRNFAARHGIAVVDANALRRRVTLSASREAAERAFGVRLRDVEQDGHWFRYPKRKPTLPPALANIVHTVLGFDERSRPGLRGRAGPAGAQGLLPNAMAALYGLVTPALGDNQCIALIEPNGGYLASDLAAACAAMQVPVPHVVEINVDKGHNAYGENPDADKEVTLDLQVLAGVAPGARLAVYFTSSSERSLADALHQAVHDQVNRPTVIVTTWGEAEILWPDQARKAMDLALQDAVRLGITVVIAAGDDLATDGMTDKAHVDYPASSPYVLACGGTQITLDAAGTGIADEVVWNDGTNGTGGGISDVYAVPTFQAKAGIPPSANDGRHGRGVPDVAASAAKINGYRIVLGGETVIASGTSGVAPLWGAFIALLNERRGHALGFVNPLLYQAPTLLKPIVSGNNMALGFGYEAGPGWNACAGLGSPKGADIIAALTAIA